MPRRTKTAARAARGSPLTGLWVGHLRPLLFSLGQAWRAPLSTVLTAGVIGIALALPFGLYLVTVNLQGLAGSWRGGVQLSVFLQHDIELDQARAIADEWSDWREVGAVDLVSPARALAEYRSLSGFDAALGALAENPFPVLMVVTPSSSNRSQAALSGLSRRLQEQPGVDSVQLDSEWVLRLEAFLELGRRAVLLLAALVVMAVLLVVGNTIRLHVEKRKDEIEITRLFGATNAFIRRPFVYTGLIYGLLGALLAAALLTVGQIWLNQAIARLADLYGSPFRLSGLDGPTLGWLVVAGGLLGMAGSWVAVQRHLRS